MTHWSNWFPYVFLPVKFIALGISCYYAIKWHMDRDRKFKEQEAAKAKLEEAEATQRAHRIQQEQQERHDK